MFITVDYRNLLLCVFLNKVCALYIVLVSFK